MYPNFIRTSSELCRGAQCDNLMSGTPFSPLDIPLLISYNYYRSFYSKLHPRAPTAGVNLGDARKEVKDVARFVEFFGGCRTNLVGHDSPSVGLRLFVLPQEVHQLGHPPIRRRRS